MEIIISIVGKIGEILIEPIGRQCRYLIHYDSNIDSLNEQVQTLEEVRNDLLVDIDEAKSKGEVIRNQVQGWKDRVEKNLLEASKILQGAARAKFHNLASRYRLSKKAEKKTVALKELKEDGKFDRVSNPAPSPKNVFQTNEDLVIFERTEKIIMEIMEALKGNKINFIGLHGMGGVGKTTLVKEIARRAEEDELFDNVAMAVVSQTVDVKNIQDQITELLRLKLEDSTVQGRARQLHNQLKDKNILVILDDIWASLDLEEVGIPFGDVAKRCKIIITTRRKQAFNTMVDTESETRKIIHLDVLSPQESWTLLKKNAGDVIESPTIKSLAEEICRQCGGLPIALVTVGRAMRQKSPADWKAAALELQKSRPVNIEGIEEKVYKGLKLSYDYLRGEEAKSIFKLCCLFPEDFDIPIEDLVRYGFGLGIFEDVVRIQEARQRTQLITNNLKDSCLLLPGKQESEVRMHDVVRDVAKSMTSGIYLVREGTEKQEGWLNAEMLTRYIGISTIKYKIDDYPDAWNYPNLQIWLMQRQFESQLPPVQVLKGMKALKVLDKRGYKRRLFRKFPLTIKLLPEFGSLTNLRTLILTDYHFSDMRVLGELKLLEILSLNGCIFDTRITSEIGELINLKLLDLGRCFQVLPLPPNVISRLHKLQEFYMNLPRMNFIWPMYFNAAELKPLSHLTILSIELQDFRCIPQGFIFPELEAFQISIGFLLPQKGFNCLYVEGPKNYSDSEEEEAQVDFEGEKTLVDCFKLLLPSTNYLQLSSFKNLKGILTNTQFKQLEELELNDCDAPEYIFERKNVPPCLKKTSLGEYERIEANMGSELEAIVAKVDEGTTDHDLILPHLRKLSLNSLPKFAAFNMQSSSFKQLQELTVRDCGEQQYIFEKKNVTPCLRRIHLKDMRGLKQIWKGSIDNIEILQSIEIEACHELKVIFHASISQELVKLETLELTNCRELESIITTDEEEGTNDHDLIFPQLRKLLLIDLPRLTAFGMECSSFKQLEELKVKDFDEPEYVFENKNVAPCLRRLHLENLKGLKQIWKGSTEHLDNIQNIEIWDCHRLNVIFNSSIARRLVKLETLKLVRGNELEAVIAKDQGEERINDHHLIFPFLKKLSLLHLPKLAAFCIDDLRFKWPSLEEVELYNCPKMKIFAATADSDEGHSTPNLKMVSLDNVEIELDGTDLNSVIQNHYKSKEL